MSLEVATTLVGLAGRSRLVQGEMVKGGGKREGKVKGQAKGRKSKILDRWKEGRKMV